MNERFDQEEEAAWIEREHAAFDARARVRDLSSVPSWDEIAAAIERDASPDRARPWVGGVVLLAAASLLLWLRLERAPERVGDLVVRGARPAAATPVKQRSELQAAGFVEAGRTVDVLVPVRCLVTKLAVQVRATVIRGQLVARCDDSAAQADQVATLAEVQDAGRNYEETRLLHGHQAATMVDLAKARGQLAAARAKLSPIAQRIEQARVHAPLDGMVVEIRGGPGETLDSGVTLMRIADLARVKAVARIGESDLPKLRVGQAVVGVTAAGSYAGRVRGIVQGKNGAEVEVDFDVPDRSLKPGVSVSLAFR